VRILRDSSRASKGKRLCLWGVLLGEPRVGVAPLLGIRKGMGRRAQGTNITLSGGPLGNLQGARLPAT
jgi:hypothetical protein